MPQPFNRSVLTNAGASLLTRAQAGEIKIEFTRITIGNGNYTADDKTFDAMQERTELKSAKNSYTFSNVEIYSDHSVKLTALITNQNPVNGEILVNEGYYINEMGIYAKVKDGDADTEVLYSIAVISGERGDFMPPYNGYSSAQIIQDYFVTVSNSAEVTINSTGAALLVDDIDKIKNEIITIIRNEVRNITDDTTKQKYRIGIENGLVYIQEVDE